MPLDDEFLALAARVRNWGRWGDDDEIGTVNLVTPEVIRRAAACVRTGRTFSLALLDPPYGQGLAESSLAAARAGGWLIPGALAVVEEAASALFTAPAGFDELERRRYDDTMLIVLRHRG